MQFISLTLTFCAISLTSAYDRGIDVSHYNGDIDWKKVKAAGINFAVAKATEGSHIEDAKFRENFKQIKAYGIQAAAYHYFLGTHPAASQVSKVEQVLQLVGFDADTDVLAVDVEERSNEDVTPDVMAQVLDDLLTGLNETFRNIYIYCGHKYWENKVSWSAYDFSRYKLWISHWNTEAPTVPSTWKREGYTWWQYSDRGTVDGIEGFVDMDRTLSNYSTKLLDSSILSIIYPSAIIV